MCIEREKASLDFTSADHVPCIFGKLHSETAEILAQKPQVVYLANLCHMLKFVLSRSFLKILLKSSGYF